MRCPAEWSFSIEPHIFMSTHARGAEYEKPKNKAFMHYGHRTKTFIHENSKFLNRFTNTRNWQENKAQAIKRRGTIPWRYLQCQKEERKKISIKNHERHVLEMTLIVDTSRGASLNKHDPLLYDLHKASYKRPEPVSNTTLNWKLNHRLVAWFSALLGNVSRQWNKNLTWCFADCLPRR